MKKIFKVFALLLALVLFTCTVTACNSGSANEEALTAEETQKVEEVAEVLDIVADIEMPDLEDCFSSMPSLMAKAKTGYEGLDSEKYQSMRLDFSLLQQASVSFILPNSLKEQLEEQGQGFAQLILSIFENIEVSYDMKGYVLLTDTACQFTYTAVKMETKFGEFDMQIDMPFGLYMDQEEVYLRYDDFKYVMKSQDVGEENPSVLDVGEVVRDYLGDTLGKWIDLDRNYVSEELAGYFTEAFAECGNMLTKELNTYSDYIEENLSKKFVKKNGKYVLGSAYFKDFVEELSANTTSQGDSFESANLQGGDMSYSRFTGDFEFDISNMEKPKIALSYDMEAEQTILGLDLFTSDAIKTKVAATSTCSYVFSGLNSTTLERPTDVCGWPGLGLLSM